MEARTGSSSSSVAYPRWVMFEKLLEIKVDSSSSCSPADNGETLAVARTITGRLIQVSLRLAEPPSLSRVCLRIPDGAMVKKPRVLAAHGDSVLIKVRIKENYEQDYTAQHFVYNAADPPRPPSLLLLPAGTGYMHGHLMYRGLCHYATGLLRRRDDELVVAELTAGWSDFFESPPTEFDLRLFRSGKWDGYAIEIGDDWDLPLEDRWDTVVAVGDRLLCWVGCYHGILLLDVLEETPRAQYLRLPMDLLGDSKSSRNVCVTAAGGALKFVNIFARCCCGGAGASKCSRSRHAYTIQTWTMRIGNGDDDMEWVKDGMVDATELWALDAYKSLPCAPLCRPMVSTDVPEVICFSLCKPVSPVWQIMVDMRRKTILSVTSHEDELGFYYDYKRDKLIPSNVSQFFNTYPTGSGGSDAAPLTGQSLIDVDIERPPAVVVDSSNPTLQQPSTPADAASVQAALSEMSEALQEIPSFGLLGPDEVKAYRILITSENGRRLRTFLRLPKDLRKDWLLMEIKTCDAN